MLLRSSLDPGPPSGGLHCYCDPPTLDLHKALGETPDRVLKTLISSGIVLKCDHEEGYELTEKGIRISLYILKIVEVSSNEKPENLALVHTLATRLEQDLFERLIAVSGIGPKVALTALYGIAPAELVQAIRSGDIAKLTRIPGVGKKTAERMVVELREQARTVRKHEVRYTARV